MKSHYWHILGIGLLTVMAFWLRFAHLDRVNFYNDEYYQFETAVGLLDSGQLQRYDFYHHTEGDTYTRASLFTRQVALSMDWFGINETAARLPAVLWGTLLIPLLFFIVWQITQKPLIAYTVASILTFDDLMIGLSRYVRMYSMLIVLCLCLGYAVYQLCEAKSWRTRFGYGLFGLVSLGLSIAIFKELTIALIAGIGLYATVRVTQWFWRRHQIDRSWLCLWLIGLAGVVLALAAELFGYNVIPLDAAIVRDQPHWTYLTQLFTNWHFASLAVVFAVVGLVTIRHVRQFITYSAVLALTTIVYFVFFSHRWDAQRYISFIIPWLDIVVAVGFIVSIEFITSLLSRWRTVRYSGAAIIVLIAGPWLSWPGLPNNSMSDVIFQKALADQTASELGFADMETAYHYVADHYQPGEMVLIQGPRFYYWTDSSIAVSKLGAYKSLSFDDFISLAQQGKGGWMVYNFSHQRHLHDEIIRFADHHFTRINELNGTLVHVYHFTAEDLVKKRPKTTP